MHKKKRKMIREREMKWRKIEKRDKEERVGRELKRRKRRESLTCAEIRLKQSY